MRFWTLLVNYEAAEAQGYVDKVLSLLREVDVRRIRRKDLAWARLLEVDLELTPRRGPAAAPEPLSGNAVYSGWLRDPCLDRIYSALRDDALLVDPLAAAVIGEFSYAAIGAQGATAATDHYATHPVYYRQGERGRWIVANDLRLVLAAPDETVAIDRRACREFLTHTVMVDENELGDGATFFSSVRKLEPGAVLEIARDGRSHDIARPRPKAALPHAVRVASTRHDYVEAFKEVFGQCVRDRMAAGPTGLLLSGGIDSSAVLGAALSAGACPPFCVSVAFDDPHLVMSQDDKLVTSLFEACDLPHRIVYADGILRLPTIDDASAYIDGPDSAANPLVKEACAAALQQRGISLAMTGEGGDVVLGEAMHEFIVDGIRESDGMAGVHRYVSRHLGLRAGSRAYCRKLLDAAVPYFGHRALRAEARRDARAPLPGYLTPALREAQSQSRSEYRPGRTGRQPAFAQRRFRYVGHRYMHGMLFPRASYFDTLNVQCLNSHPFLDPRMMAFALSCPPHMHHDYFELDRTNPYASAKMLARLAYRHELPPALCAKTHKTSYAGMARRMFHNSARALYTLAAQPMLLEQWGLVDQKAFRRHLCAYIAATEDPNANLGINYHYIRGVCDLEVWLRRFCGTRAEIDAQLAFRPLRALA